MSYSSFKVVGATVLLTASVLAVGACSTPESLIGPTAPAEPTVTESPLPEESATPLPEEPFVVPMGYTETVLTFDTGSLVVATPSAWQVSDASVYKPGEDSFWKASLLTEGDVGAAGNPGAAIVYQDLKPGESEDILKNFETLAEELTREYSDFEEEENFEVPGATRAIHLSGTNDGIHIDMVMAMSDDKDTLAMLLTGYTGKEMSEAGAAIVVDSLRFTE